MKTLKVLMLVAILGLSMSFINSSKKISFKSGVFGSNSCDCMSEEIRVKMQLNFKEDNTFTYFDNFNPKRVVDVSGKWEMKGNAIVLSDYSSDYKMPDKWVLNTEGKCIKTRLGLAWYRLCSLKECN